MKPKSCRRFTSKKKRSDLSSGIVKACIYQSISDPITWKRSHVEDLFTDLNGAIQKGASEYFLGSIIVVDPPESSAFIEVYDGQQRLATTMILIAAIRDFFILSLRDEREASTITGLSLLSGASLAVARCCIWRRRMTGCSRRIAKRRFLTSGQILCSGQFLRHTCSCNESQRRPQPS